jgi:molecular chaperone DnaK (HSP70)
LKVTTDDRKDDDWIVLTGDARRCRQARHGFELLRRGLVAAVGRQIRAPGATALEAVQGAGLEPGAIDLVVTTGGSSLIPACHRTHRPLPRLSARMCQGCDSPALRVIRR